MEGVHWKRGQQIGIGGCSTCYCAWDLSQGQLMCVKQVRVFYFKFDTSTFEFIILIYSLLGSWHSLIIHLIDEKLHSIQLTI